MQRQELEMLSSGRPDVSATQKTDCSFVRMKQYGKLATALS